MTVRTGDTGNVAVHEALTRRKYQAADHKHPVNVIHHERATFGESLADGIASFIGSWRFLIIQTLLVATWVTINTLQVTGKIHIDPYPYILLNLAFSTQAAYTGPVLLLAGNRQFSQWLTTREIRHTWVQTQGQHSFRVWRRNLAQFAPLLFREK